jgi:hypothetical protein
MPRISREDVRKAKYLFRVGSSRREDTVKTVGASREVFRKMIAHPGCSLIEDPGNRYCIN